MRLVKKTVNQDDVSAYHLFYADGEARAGHRSHLLRFSGGPGVARNQQHFAHGIACCRRKEPGYWRDRLKSARASARDIVEVDGRLTLPFEGTARASASCCSTTAGAGSSAPWDKSPVPAEHQIRGLGPIVLTVHELARTASVLTEVMNMRRLRDYAAHGAQIHVFAMGEGGPAAELHVIEDKDSPVAHQGAGGVHHVAFRTPDETQYHAWTQRLNELRIPNSGEVDRFYFRSLYFREPNGILFEIATDGPGFATDEQMATLGERLALPPFLEPAAEGDRGGVESRWGRFLLGVSRRLPPHTSLFGMYLPTTHL